MDDEIKKKRYYIYENIDRIKNHDQIIDLIQFKECKFTKNNNGIFLNLSVLDEEIINMIHQIIINSLDYEEKNEDYMVPPVNIEVDEGVQKEKLTKENEKEREKILMKHFSKKEQEIIHQSKKYNL
tara:strand:+ start:463 stop:840 length:378 start_codon:yes stop_codon:yes gene_type:complete